MIMGRSGTPTASIEMGGVFTVVNATKSAPARPEGTSSSRASRCEVLLSRRGNWRARRAVTVTHTPTLWLTDTFFSQDAMTALDGRRFSTRVRVPSEAIYRSLA